MAPSDLDLLLRTLGKAVLLPPGGPIFLVAAGLLLTRFSARVGRAFAAIGLASLYATATPLFSAWLVDTASGGAQVVDISAARQAQAIVILGGGVRRNAIEFGGDTLGRLSLERVRYGARLARALSLPVLVTGGSVRGDTKAEAQLMREALETEFSIPVRWVEEKSRNTRENAGYSAAMLRESGVDRVVLVLHAFDVPRAREEFERARISVIPAPTHLPGTDNSALLSDFLPSASALASSHFAVYELLAQRLTFRRD
jgi:uncharacterized SAM-binding protein YcdF (DUF218 family)